MLPIFKLLLVGFADVNDPITNPCHNNRCPTQNALLIITYHTLTVIMDPTEFQMLHQSVIFPVG